MRLVDANVLLYAVNESSDRHAAARRWLDDALGGQEAVGFAWVVLLAFLRLSTRHGIFPRPLAVEAATATVDGWLAAPSSALVEPAAGHAARMGRLLAEVGSGGNVVNDAHLGALALELGATIVTWDNDFGRFPGVSWMSPPAV